MFLGMLTSFLVPESKRARLEELAGEKDDVYALQASTWRNRGGVATGEDAVVGSPSATARGSGSSRSGGWESERGLREGHGEKRWWKGRTVEVNGHAV